MTERNQTTSPTLREQINAIADTGTSSYEVPADTSWEDVNDWSTELYDQLEDHIQTVKTNSTLSQADAEMWGLRNTVGAQHTTLTDEAIVSILREPNTPFQALAEGLDEITTSAVRAYAGDVTAVVDRAQNLAVAVSSTKDARPESPAIAVLDSDTKRRLQNAATPEEASLDTVVSRLLDESETRLTLREFCEQYLNERGRENINQLAVDKIPLREGRLCLTVHDARPEGDTEVEKETDKITIEDRQFDFHIVEDPYGPHSFNRIPVYGWTDADEEDIALNEGVAAVRKRVQELLAGGELVHW